MSLHTQHERHSSAARTTASPAHLEAFESLKWATPYLTSPEWVVYERTRGADPNAHPDRFCDSTIRANDGVQTWLELYLKPLPGNKAVTKTLSLIRFGNGLQGFPGICHGGATLTLMDEGLGYCTVANVVEEMGYEAVFKVFGGGKSKVLYEAGKTPQEVLKGRMVTAKMEIKFVRPVLCPGVVGIEVDVLESNENEMRIKGVMKDAEGRALMEAEALFVKIGRKAKL